MVYFLGAIALIILGFVLVVTPIGIHVKGKLIILLLIVVMSMVGIMTRSFLHPLQTGGVLLILVILFTYLLYKRGDSFFSPNEEAVKMEEDDQKKLSLPYRMKDTAVTPFSRIEHTKEVNSVQAENLFVKNEETSGDFKAKEIMDNHLSEIDFKNSLEPKQEQTSTETNIQNDHLHNIDQDLETLVNRSVGLDEVVTIENENPVVFLDHEEEVEPFMRDLEGLMNNSEDLPSSKEKERDKFINDMDENVIQYVDNEHVIDEILLSPIRKMEEKEEELYSPFDLIEEIKEFKNKEKNE